MNIPKIISGLPITLIEALATNEKGEQLFVVPKILVFRSKRNIGIGNIGSRNIIPVNIESKVSGYIPSVYGDQAYELGRCVTKLLDDPKEINIVGKLKNKSYGYLTGVLMESYSWLSDESGPHTGWIRIVAKSYKVEILKDLTESPPTG